MASPLGLTDNSKISYGEGSRSSYTGQYNSIFNGSKFYYKPAADKSGNSNKSAKSTKRNQSRINSQNDSLYDISTTSIIKYIENNNLTSMQLTSADFGFLRDYGVYPNNRLVCIRRFASPVDNDLTNTSQKPIATVLSYIKDTEDYFFDFELGEDWKSYDSADPLKDLSDIFNDVFEKASGVNAGNQLEGGIAGAAKLIPIGGVAEAFQTSVMNYLLGTQNPDGTFNNGTNFTYDNIPQGNPNFMSQSSYREVGSIKSNINISVKTAYEIKFIPGVDPTIVYMDIIQNILRMVGSESVFYISQTGGSNINRFFNEYGKGNWIGAVGIILDGIKNAIFGLTATIDRVITKITDAAKTGFQQNGILGGAQGAAEGVRDTILDGLRTIAASSLARYRIQFAKIIPAATGAASAPWHITIGNPKSPFFSSGDMILENAKVRLGNTLGFNDIPTRIDVEFTIKCARNMGIQEIFDKFNNGSGRQYQRTNIQYVKDFYDGAVRKDPNSPQSSVNPVTGAN